MTARPAALVPMLFASTSLTVAAPLAGDVDAGSVLPEMTLPRGGRRAADGVARRPVDFDARLRIGQGGGAGGVGADEVALQRRCSSVPLPLI